MNDVASAISLNGVGKVYRIYSNPFDRIREIFSGKSRHAQHWALRAATLDIAKGETFGLVGENGAGKSTFLKLVAGTLKPSVGRLQVHGRVAALLELGAGFHPEESGRENVMLMAAMNGIPASQTDDYIREVVAFSELSADVIERPVKTYSSGMFMRLAFSAATAVDPDVLVIDEALSVGDMHFQKKSLDRIMRFRERGKTVLFCSHNLYQVRSLCSRAIWMHHGEVRESGDTEGVVTAYESYERAKDKPALAETSGALTGEPASKPVRAGSIPARIADVLIETPDGINPATIATFQSIRIIFEVDIFDPDCRFHIGFAITRNDRENVFGSATHFDFPEQAFSGSGLHRIAVRIPDLPLLSGDYMLSVYLLDDTGLQVIDMAEAIRPFRVLQTKREFGFMYMPHQWERQG
ncbi:MAG: ABC transporter ATP-binding protein [Zoogloeaceae bacterium]|nr:ABC transporter ATP-binding protein [Zoogloeaceae bacterium]